MLKVICPHCKNEQTLKFYIYDVRILAEDNPMAGSGKDYIASAIGKTICPTCGEDIRQHFKNVIYRDDIIDLATRRWLQ